ncbi:MAG TPA: DUF4197 domain-containing protein [Candidatus Acidoferrum sp.]|nr:DUF4197 domain-containing protein [Candidatus Acidoferrum sp.]
MIPAKNKLTMGCRSVMVAVLALLAASALLRADAANQGGLSDTQISSGLKEALRVGATNAVKIVGRPDGYFKNEAVKILLPKNLRPLETGLRAVGYGPKIDAFVLSMNRAAEAAAPSARQIFLNAILSMSFDDARKILTGGDTAATDYFKAKTTPQLTTAFRPIVKQTMAKNTVTQQYDALTAQAKSIPFMKSEDLDITDYVVSKALDGLFYELGQEETKIRKDPAAQTTSLLKQIFGK